MLNVTVKGHDSLNELSSVTNSNKINSILLLSPIFGWIISTAQRLCWQDPIETAQVLAGLVSYPPNNPFYIMHIKSWSLVNQLAALMLAMGLSDFTVNTLIAGVVGSVSFAGISLLVYAISKKTLIALFTPMVMYSLSLVGASNGYPIAFLGSSSSYGILGLSFTLLAIGLLGCGYYRTGVFLVGLAPAIHPSMGAFCILISSITILLTMHDLKTILPRLTTFFILGFIITLGSLGTQLHITPDLPYLEPALKQHYLAAFIQNFDYHRNAGSWSSPAIFLALLTAILSASIIRLNNIPLGAKLVLYSIVISVPSAFIMILAGESLKPFYFFKVLISWRFTNYANICIIPLCFGLLSAEYTPTPKFRAGLLISLIFVLFTYRLARLPNENILFFSLLFLVFIVVQARTKDRHESIFTFLYNWQWVFLTILVIMLFFRQIVPGVITLASGKTVLRNCENTNIYRITSQRQGVLLTAGGMHLIQLVTRRPVLLDGGALDMFPYIPETGPLFNAILRNVYGYDIFVTPPEDARNKATIPFSHQQLWEKRTAAEWQAIRRGFDVTEILTPSNWKLQLPLIATEEDIDGKLAPFYLDQATAGVDRISGLTLYAIP